LPIRKVAHPVTSGWKIMKVSVQKNVTLRREEVERWQRYAAREGITLAELIRSRVDGVEGGMNRILEGVPMPSLLSDMRIARETAASADESEGIKAARIIFESSPRVFLENMGRMEKEYLEACKEVLREREETARQAAEAMQCDAGSAGEEAKPDEASEKLLEACERYLKAAGV